MTSFPPHHRARYAIWARAWWGSVLLSMLLSSAVWVFETPSHAEPASATPMKPKVEIELMVVHATNAHDRVDPRLQPVLQHLRFLQFKGFTLLSMDEKELSVGGSHTFSVAGDRSVVVDVVERDERQVKLRVRMSNERGMFLDTTIRIHRDKSFMIGGPDHDGGKLLLPITARY
jgi:hypothetical protein